ncbi:hypothetical protein OUZ56_025473 [Daphnia magna]|uniref:Uncharacterized protein n=1 Tax=Daphnia magna TaxID=35525 RepID=A0ABQ9ZLD5_9CRUS|nr:hypothetical protein OUZ56_025473 [Daphnia magna]
MCRHVKRPSQYDIRELVQRYNLPWSQRDVYRSCRTLLVFVTTVGGYGAEPFRGILRIPRNVRRTCAGKRLVEPGERLTVLFSMSGVMSWVFPNPPLCRSLETQLRPRVVRFWNLLTFRQSLSLQPPEVLEAARLVVGCRVSFSPIQNALHRVQRWFKVKTDGIRRSPLPEEGKTGEGQRKQILERAASGLEQLGITRERYERLQGPLIRKTIRPKRGLLDARGSALNWLLGVATDKSLEGLNDHLEALGKETSGIVHTMNQQATLVNDTLRELQDHALAIDQLDHSLLQSRPLSWLSLLYR